MFSIKLPTHHLKGALFFLLLVLIEMVIILAKGCSTTIPNGKYKFDPQTSARATAPITTDTTRPITFSTQSLYSKKIDTLDMVVSQYLGHSMTVDNSDLVKQILFRITRELRSDTTLKK